MDLILLTKATEKIGLAKQNDQIVELVIDRPDAPQLIGSIFLGKVIKVDESLQAAFVDLGQTELAYLEKNQIPAARKNRKQSISTHLYEGQSIVVQVTKDAYQDKGARITMNITVPNQVLVYLPYGDYLAVSKKLPQKEAQTLKAELNATRRREEGLIIRTEARDYSIDQLNDQWDQLRENWQSILANEKDKTAPELLWADHAVTERFIRRFPSQKIEHIFCDQVTVAKQIRARYPELAAKVEWIKEIEDLLISPIDDLIQKLVHPEVQAANGVMLMIDQTEALTVIDVNSSGFNGKMNQHQFAYKVNRIAVDEIAKQIRLRNLSGMIIIDFLRMKDKGQQNKIINQLTRRFKDDPTRTEVYGFTALGLFELTRKREAPNHLLSLTDTPVQGKFLSLESKVYALERELIASQTEAMIVEVTKGFYQIWKQWINADIFKEEVISIVYFVETKGVADYHIKRSGSEQLINEFLLDNNQLKVDKV